MQLDYAFLCSPDPLQAGSHATLTLVVSNPRREIATCSAIVITFPLGVSAKDLAVSAGGIEVTVPEGWSARADGGCFTLTADSGSVAVGADGLTFAFASILLNDQPGVAHILIEETIGSGAPASTEVPVAKFPALFAMSELRCDQVEVAAPGAVSLDWTAAQVPGCTFAIAYEPGNDVPAVSVPVGNIGPLKVQHLTRRGSVTFTLTATAVVPGADTPLTYQRQATVAVDAPDLVVWVEPPTVGIHGLVRLNWSAQDVDHCVVDGAQMPTSGCHYYILTADRTFTVTAVDSEGKRRQAQATVTVDPGIVPTEAGYVLEALSGRFGRDGTFTDTWTGFDDDMYGDTGSNGNDAATSWTIDPLDPLDPVAGTRVVPITVTGGVGGMGGQGGGYKMYVDVPASGGGVTIIDLSQYASGGSGGRGGNAEITLYFNNNTTSVAQYIIRIAGGQGGVAGGPSFAQFNASPTHGLPGTASLMVDGQPVALK